MNYSATARSNYFRVKDEAAFRAWAKRSGLEVHEDTEAEKFERSTPDGSKQFMIAPADGGAWPCFGVDEQSDQQWDIDLPKELAAHLHEEDVAVLMEAGAEGLRYVNGTAWAVNALGKVKYVGLHTIYRRAAGMGKRVTLAEF
jgi:hypothetical protein